MGRTPCCEKVGLKKGPWTPEEDQKLVAYIEDHGHGSWRALPAKAGLQRCGKSCRLRWTNYLRPDIKRGKFSLQEEQTIIQLHALLGNRWSTIATHLPKRTDNEIKNYWNTHLKKRLTKMGIDPVTHKPKTHAISASCSDSSSSANTISHMAQWESARLEAEARSARESMLKSNASLQLQQPPQPRATITASASASSPSLSAKLLNKVATQPAAHALCLDVLRAWEGIKSESIISGSNIGLGSNYHSLESPTSTLSFSENSISIPGGTELVRNSSCNFDGITKEGGEDHDEYWKGYEKCLTDFAMDDQWTFESLKTGDGEEPYLNFIDGFTDLLLGHFDDRDPMNDSGRESDYVNGSTGDGGGGGTVGEDYEKNVFRLVDTSSSEESSVL